MYKNSVVHHITKICVDILFYLGIVCCILVLFLSKDIIKYFHFNQQIIIPFTIVLFLSGSLSVYILYQLKIIFKTLIGGSPFVEENIDCLRKISVASFMIAILYVIKCFFSFTISTVIIIIIFAIASLFCLTVKDLFKQALHYKNENDLTV